MKGVTNYEVRFTRGRGKVCLNVIGNWEFWNGEEYRMMNNEQ
ncbi:hypothetical protein A33Q_0126 [Indibacter alkaliphilus LW1]|uniref:Uncharacterized protein n=1 Tax=Indibacter alkaliphilus (strain CCUG 57479 / KCTC 22604 / LW1) TaxID=1189612 RepID=S2DMA7_INDAL|nr:hypothetical protein A33Q_0126 [Indibacter alkaliphilus LW1]